MTIVRLSVHAISVLCIFALSQCVHDMSREISMSELPPSGWRPGDIARLKKDLIYMDQGDTAYIGSPPENYRPQDIIEPFPPYKIIAPIRKGERIMVARITKSLLPSSVGGTRTIVRILDGKLAGKEAKIDSGSAPDLYYKGQFYAVPDHSLYQLISVR